MLEELIKKNIKKVCINKYPVYTLNGSPITYKDSSFEQFAKEARQNGKTYFYADPVNPKNEYGPYKKSKPRYRYVCTFSITEDQYKGLFINK